MHDELRIAHRRRLEQRLGLRAENPIHLEPRRPLELFDRRLGLWARLGVKRAVVEAEHAQSPLQRAEPRRRLVRARAVIVPVAKSRGFVSHATLREVSRLGDDWRRETEQRVETRDDDGFGPTESIEANEGATFDGFAGDPPPAVATSLCVVDGDGVAVVVAVARGLVEPEECDSAVKDDDTLLSSAFANEDDAFDDAARVKAGPVVMGDASDDEESLLDERDAGEPDLGVADRGRE